MLAAVPVAALGAIVVYAATRLVNLAEFLPTLPTAVEADVAWYAERHGALPAGWQSLARPAAGPPPVTGPEGLPPMGPQSAPA